MSLQAPDHVTQAQRTEWGDTLKEGSIIATGIFATVMAVGYVVHTETAELHLGQDVKACADNFVKYDKTMNGARYQSAPPECESLVAAQSWASAHPKEEKSADTGTSLVPTTMLVGDINNPSVVEVTTTSTTIGPVKAAEGDPAGCQYGQAKGIDDGTYRDAGHDCLVKLSFPNYYDLHELGDRLIQTDENRKHDEMIKFAIMGGIAAILGASATELVIRNVGDDDKPGKHHLLNGCRRVGRVFK